MFIILEDLCPKDATTCCLEGHEAIVILDIAVYIL